LIHTHTHNHKNSPGVQWNTHFKSNDFSAGEGWVWRTSPQGVRKLFCKALHSEGDAGHSPLRARRAQRALLGTAVYGISWDHGMIDLSISNFPSWSQSTGCRQQLYNSSTSQNVQFCRRVRLQASGVSGAVRSAWEAQFTTLVQRQGKCQVIPIQCTPANYSCSASKNTMLAGSGIARGAGGWGPAPPLFRRFYNALFLDNI